MKPSEIALPATDVVLGKETWWVDYVDRLKNEYGCEIDDVTRFVCELQAMTARIVLSNPVQGLALARGQYLPNNLRAH